MPCLVESETLSHLWVKLKDGGSSNFKLILQESPHLKVAAKARESLQHLVPSGSEQMLHINEVGHLVQVPFLYRPIREDP